MKDNAKLQRLIPYIDLTALSETENEQSITHLCSRANTSLGPVAAVCVAPTFVPLVKQLLPNINVATVANFPSGDDDFATTSETLLQALAAGANEIDVVMPYKNYQLGLRPEVINYIKRCKKLCHARVKLKVIIETGALGDEQHITNATVDMIKAGADMIKTSTGKVEPGATLEAASIILYAIKATDASVGFKAAGGIATLDDAINYLELAQTIMGPNWVSPDTFRIGSSKLLD